MTPPPDGLDCSRHRSHSHTEPDSTGAGRRRPTPWGYLPPTPAPLAPSRHRAAFLSEVKNPVDRSGPPVPPGSTTIRDMPDHLLSPLGGYVEGEHPHARLAAWNDYRDAWLAEHGLIVSWRETQEKHRRRAEEHWLSRTQDRLRTTTDPKETHHA